MKSIKGQVSVVVSHTRLQLRFRHGGKRHTLSIGLPDTTVNRKAAEAKARQIELDIVSGNFDSTLGKYKPPAAQSSMTTETTMAILNDSSENTLVVSVTKYKVS